MTLRPMYKEDPNAIYPIKLFVKGDPYKMWGVISWDRHLFGVDHARQEESFPSSSSEQTAWAEICSRASSLAGEFHSQWA